MRKVINSQDSQRTDTRELTFVVYIDHWENGNLRLNIEEIKKKIENPITLKTLGEVIFESEKFLVVENFYPKKLDFIFKKAIILRKSFIPK